MKQIPKRLQNSVDRIKQCGGIILIHHTSTGGIAYALSDSREVAEPVVTKLRDAGYLVSGKDGLFDGQEQTLHLVAA
jgi:hypothetical protein